MAVFFVLWCIIISMLQKRTKTIAIASITIFVALVIFDQTNTPAITSTEKINANNFCLKNTNATPPLTYSSDGCSMFPDGPWQSCCITHDISYWCGGDKNDRVQADIELSRCVASISPTISKLMYTGVSFGGSPQLPFPWRWGYGFPYPYKYDQI